MLKGLVSKVFGTRHEREAKKLMPLVNEINAVAERLTALSDDELKAQTEKFRNALQERIGDAEAELAELREKKRHTEDAGEREDLTRQIQHLEDQIKQDTQDTLDELLP